MMYSLETRDGEYMDTWISPRIPCTKPGKKLKLRFSRVGKRSEPYGQGEASYFRTIDDRCKIRAEMRAEMRAGLARAAVGWISSCNGNGRVYSQDWVLKRDSAEPSKSYAVMRFL